MTKEEIKLKAVEVKKLLDKGYTFRQVKDRLKISSTSVVAYYANKINGKFKTRQELLKENEELREELKKVQEEVEKKMNEQNIKNDCIAWCPKCFDAMYFVEHKNKEGMTMSYEYVCEGCDKNFLFSETDLNTIIN